MNSFTQVRAISQWLVRPSGLRKYWRVAFRRMRAWGRYRRLYKKYRAFTMVPRGTFVNNLQLADTIRGVDGCIIECGVWRGGCIAAMAELLGPGREYVLFDSFAGLPSAQEIDGPAALAWQADIQGAKYFDNCTAPKEFAERAMQLSGAARVQIHAGWFEQTLPGFCPPGPIALLRLDADWYESTLICLRSLFPHVASGGLVLIDDYRAWDGCRRAVHEYLAETKSTARVLQWHNDVTYLVVQ